MLISYDSLLIGGEWVRQSAAWSSASGPSLGTCGACGSQACEALVVFVLADLATGEPLGEQSLGRGRLDWLRALCAIRAGVADQCHDAVDHRRPRS